jgi:hypothetical protein
MKVIKKRNITNEYKKNKVYDLRIKNNHNYYITKSNILVHNSGKSFVIKQISGGVEPKIVNTDVWTEYYMKYDPQFKWEKYADKTKHLTKAQLINYLNSLLPLWIDGTSSNSSAVLRRKGILQSIGYDCAMIFVDTPVDTAVERNKQRGRTVDREFLEQSYKETQKLKSYYSSEFKWFTEILNGEGELIDKVILSAYKKMNTFFSSPINNPIGRELKDEMLESGQKYLIDRPEYDMNYLKKLVDSWYRS